MSATTTQTITKAPAYKGDFISTFNYHKAPTPVEEACIYGTAAFWRKKYEQRQSVVHDIRGHEDEFKLDVHGFQFRHHKSAVTDFNDDEQIKKIYYPEVESYLKESTGASRIIFIVHVNRKHSLADVKKTIASHDDTSDALLGLVPPLTHVHVDQSYDGINNMIDYCAPAEDAEKLKNCRHAIINVWRPTRTVRRDPLALSDARSIDEEDLVEVRTNLAKGRSNGTWGVLPPDIDEKTGRQEKHKWYWCSEMTPEEVFLFKIIDSRKDGTARRDPHCAVEIPGTENEETRTSIEMRCMVFWEDQQKE